MDNIQQSEGGAHNASSSNTGHRHPQTLPVPRIWGARQVAARLNRSVEWFYSHLPRLKQLGFPSKDNILGGYDSIAVDAWMDRRAGLKNVSNIEDQMLEAIRGNC
jgi:hypothetical protein